MPSSQSKPASVEGVPTQLEEKDSRIDLSPEALEQDEIIEYPSGGKLALITIGLALATFVVG